MNMTRLQVIMRRLGNILTRACPTPKFDSWLMKKRVIREGGRVHGFRSCGNQVVVECTLSSGEKIAFREYATDALILYEVLWRKQYHRMVDVLLYLQLSPLSILDGGANIGSFLLFAKECYPSAKIVCVEPDLENGEVLMHNLDLNGFEGITVVNGAIWSSDCKLYIHEGFRENRERELSFSVKEKPNKDKEKPTSGFSIVTLANKFSNGRFDVVKLDIEGAESEVLANTEAILALFKICKLLVIEIHDEVFDRFWFFRTLNELGLCSMTDGELTYVW